MEKSTLDPSGKGNHMIHSKLIMDWAKVLHWFDKSDMLQAIHGEAPKRHRRMEIDLYRLTKRGKLRTTHYGKKLIYSLPRKSKNFDGSKVYHGLACTKCLIRLYKGWEGSEIIPERTFAGCGSVPDGGLINEDKLLTLELTTKDNFFFSGNMRGKLAAYEGNIYNVEEKFSAKAIVLFVIDVPRAAVERYVGSLASARPDGDVFPVPFYFVDYESFLSIPLGETLKAPIYFYTDGKEYPLRK